MSTITFKLVGGKELAETIRGMDKKFQRDINRGAVGEACNAIRDRARQNANAVGLSTTGQHPTPSGKVITRHGRIPGAISAAVERPKGTKCEGKVYVAPIGLKYQGATVGGGVGHWRWVEWGSIHNSPTPFWVRSGAEAAAEAIERAMAVYVKWVDLYNKTK